MNAVPDHTAIRTALWRALHLEVDAPPPVLVDRLGLDIAAPEEGWRGRGDMDADGTRFFRASIVARARFVEDLVLARAAQGVSQYVILGAGLDTFAQRRLSGLPGLRVFEIDQPATQDWKRQRLQALGLEMPQRLHLVPVDFEAGDDWLQKLAAAGFDARQPSVIAAAGVSMYLSREAILDMLARIAALAHGTTLAMTFLLPLESMAPELRPGFEMAAKGARAGGTPFLSFFAPEEILALAHQAGFAHCEHIFAGSLSERYFSGRSDGLWLPRGEEFLVAAA